MSKLELGKEQIKVMRVLWKLKRATAQEVTDALNDDEPTKLVCVQMLLCRLVQKKTVSYDVDDRTYIYFPLIKQEQVTSQALQTFIDHIFAGSTDEMVSYVLKNEPVSPDVLNEIRNLLDGRSDEEEHRLIPVYLSGCTACRSGLRWPAQRSFSILRSLSSPGCS